ncbi:hypothetical protein SBV1_1860035 [Verrucomicrobia bacterium]|nr:hypothetical protein SBV1_1860035 [Verrucomicrobiota bacterium]
MANGSGVEKKSFLEGLFERVKEAKAYQGHHPRI